MADAVYHFISNWKVKSSKEEVYDVLGELLRRNAVNTEEKLRIARPPQPTFPHNLTKNKIL